MNAFREPQRLFSARGVGVRASPQPLLPDLLALSKCKDYVLNRGHYFGTSMYQEEPPLKDDDKRALIEYLKTF